MPSQPPDPYVRQFDFTNHEQTQPTKPVPGSKVDLELNEVRESVNATISRLNEIQQDDGMLRPTMVSAAVNQRVADAELARDVAMEARDDAVTAKVEAEAAKDQVVAIADGLLDETSPNSVVSWAVGAANSSETAIMKASEAALSASSAAAQAGLAQTRANAAATSANAAAASADAAAQSAVDAEASAQAAEDAAASVNPSNFIPQPAVAPVDGQILAFDGTAWVALDNYAQVLQESVRNETGATLAKGSVVYISGASGNKPLVAKAQANSEAGSSKTFAVLAADIANNNNGNAVTSGLLKGLDLSAYAAGAALWLSPTVAGGLTTTKPAAPDHAVLVGFVVRSHATQGEILVKVANGYELAELHDVSAANPDDDYSLTFEAATGLWKPKPRNPFNQDLNTDSSPQFSEATVSTLYVSGSGLGNKIVFPDDTEQTTAAVFYDQSLNIADNVSFNEVATSKVAIGGTVGDTRLEYAGLSFGDAGSTIGPVGSISFDDATTQTTAGLSPADAAATYGERVDIQTFGSPTSSGTFTWTKPAGAKMVQVRMIGGGSAGTSGSCNPTANGRTGGGGGAGGGSSMMFIPASELGSTVTVTVGAGGASNPGRDTAGSGQFGGSGGFSAFGNYRVSGGQAPTNASSGGVGVPGTVLSLVNSISSTSGGSGVVGTGGTATSIATGQFIATGGGGGGGAAAGSTANAFGGPGGSRTNGTSPAQYSATLAGGAFGNSTLIIPATNGADQDVPFATGTGGGGGYYRTGEPGNNGGNGGWPGGGGGGGGASDLGFMSGSGGAGGNGMVTVITYF